MDMSKANYGILHTHSEYSVRDSAMSLEAMFERAKELGAPAIALTDHGILANYFDFMKMGKEYGIKSIPGMEAYFVPDAKTDRKPKGTKQHLILMAKDNIGFHAISEAVYRSYTNLVEDFPRMDYEILQACFGPGSEGHGHVIATSACMQGVLAQILLERHNVEKDTEKLYKKRDKYHPIDNELLDAVQHEEDLQQELEELISERTKLEELSKINVTGLKRSLKTMDPGSEDYASISKELESKTRQKEEAKAALPGVKERIAKKRKEKTAYGKSIAKIKESATKWQQIDSQISDTLKNMKPEEALYKEAKAAAVRFSEIFGKDSFYIELQYHHIERERYVMPRLAKLAAELEIPIVATNDAHYATNRHEDVRAHTLVRAMRYNDVIGDETLDEGYGEMYMKSDSELMAALSDILDESTISKAMDGIKTIVDKCNVELETGEHYPVFVGGKEGETAAERLRRLAIEGIPHRYPGSLWTSEMEERMEYELDVINSSGYSDYLCIVQDFLDYARSLGVKYFPAGTGYVVGPGRGSAVGSIVCYLTGITDVDPIKYGLIFERFLNKDRVSMPDIDSDFHTELRSQVVDYVKSKYGEKAVCNILTKGRMAGKAAIRNVGRVTNIPDSVVNMAARMVPSTSNAKITDAIGLDDFCSHNPLAKQLIDDAKLVEGVMNNYGMHAAGVIIADNGDVSKYVPLMYNTDKEQWVAQCDMGQSEKDAGLLKMDFLGLRNLDIITDARQRIYENRGIVFDMNNLPLEPDVFREIFCKGNTNSIFQFESPGMRDMLRKFKPASMEDLILLVAAYRPGPMKYIPDIIAVKRGEKSPTYIADGLKEILDVTYGCTIYQEQVMQIFNKVAGFTLGEADIIRRAMSKKKLEILTDPETDYHGKFIVGMVKAGAKETEAEAFWNELLDFASYAFNKSHAAAYAVVAYMTAYLKYHYPAEYMCAVMSRTPSEKLPALITECRRMRLKIMPPDINRSANSFINTGDTIWYGFSGIKGVVTAGAEIMIQRETPYTSIKDFIYRITRKNSPVSKDVISNLIESGAFDVFCEGNRQSLLKEIEPFIEIVKKLKEAQTKYQETVNNKEYLETNGASEKELKKAECAVTAARTKLENYQEAYALHNFVFVPEDQGEKLAKEHELLGAYISGNPFDQYVEAVKLIPKAVSIYDVQEGQNSTICGIVSNLKVFQRKTDGRLFCSFTLSDLSGEIEVKCFTKEYPKYENLIQEGAALTVSGKARLQDAYGDPDGAAELFMTAKTINKLNPLRKERIIISGETLLTWAENYDLIYSYEQPDGYECYFNDQSEMVMRRCDFRVSKDILQLQCPSLLISSLSIA